MQLSLKKTPDRWSHFFFLNYKSLRMFSHLAEKLRFETMVQFICSVVVADSPETQEPGTRHKTLRLSLNENNAKYDERREENRPSP